jgi:hypothetical protein
VGANLDPNQKFFFWLREGQSVPGAKALVNVPLSPQGRKGPRSYQIWDVEILPSQDSLSSWFVCAHLSEPEKIHRYYLSSGLLAIQEAKCLCQDCLDQLSATHKALVSIQPGMHLSDRVFYKDFVKPLFAANRQLSRILDHMGESEKPCQTWVICPHLTTLESISELYLNSESIFLFESYCACGECLDQVIAANSDQMLAGARFMSDHTFQDTIFALLCRLNLEFEP